MNNVPDRETYMAAWAKQLGVPNNPWFIVEHLINVAHNWDSAVSIMFELSWRFHKDYLDRALKDLKAWAGPTVEKGGKVTANELYGFMDFYIKNTEALPK